MAIDQKVVVITGGLGPVGTDTARRLCGLGYKVAVLDSDEVQGLALQKELGEAALFVKHDIADIANAPAAMKAVIDRFGAIDIMVNSAEEDIAGQAMDITSASWDDAMLKNLKGIFFAIQAAVPYMQKNKDGGNIVNISSIRAQIATGDHLLYASAKAGLTAMSRELATDLWRYGIKCNVMSPWLVVAEDDPRMKDEEFVAWLKDISLSNKVMKPKDVSEVVAFLISDDAYCVNAFDLFVDDGMNIARDKPTLSAYK